MGYQASESGRGGVDTPGRKIHAPRENVWGPTRLVDCIIIYKYCVYANIHWLHGWRNKSYRSIESLFCASSMEIKRKTIYHFFYFKPKIYQNKQYNIFLENVYYIVFYVHNYQLININRTVPSVRVAGYNYAWIYFRGGASKRKIDHELPTINMGNLNFIG